ncbi:hypothetical protein NP233_g431 [Leucocoprinus birnbaumii]|uniref:Uncharacterized protein n=1 Tax=Leucocoprinus birnbaumii TaxID=56174 RepID=A0AAD5YYN0_9AGAR|nr:hypothetical protein NP233_g431 [Leucocoprinus birnbaumii]
MPRSPRSQLRQDFSALRDANEEEITAFLLRFAVNNPTPASCRHGGLTPMFYTAKRKNAPLSNAGRWHGFCRSCKKWRWLSPPLDIPNLLRNEEFANLVDMRDFLCSTPYSSGKQSHPTRRPPKRFNNDESMADLFRDLSISSQLPATSTVVTNSLSRTILLKFWIEDFMGARSIEVPRTAGGAFCLEDHKLLLGAYGIEQVDGFEIYNKTTRSWNPIFWSRSIFPGTETELLFRLQGVTVLPDFAPSL